ncbi:unnamed protein product [Choristocarpus tenellus]
MVHFIPGLLALVSMVTLCNSFMHPGRPLSPSVSSHYRSVKHSPYLGRKMLVGDVSPDEQEMPKDQGTPDKRTVTPADLGFTPTSTGSSKQSLVDEDKNSYPINLPSYALLLLSVVVAIAFVGCIFEATGPKPVMGYPLTYAVGTLSFPGFLFLFYAAIKKGQAETEEADDPFR